MLRWLFPKKENCYWEPEPNQSYDVEEIFNILETKTLRLGIGNMLVLEILKHQHKLLQELIRESKNNK